MKPLLSDWKDLTWSASRISFIYLHWGMLQMGMISLIQFCDPPSNDFAGLLQPMKPMRHQNQWFLKELLMHQLHVAQNLMFVIPCSFWLLEVLSSSERLTWGVYTVPVQVILWWLQFCQQFVLKLLGKCLFRFLSCLYDWLTRLGVLVLFLRPLHIRQNYLNKTMLKVSR